MRKAIIWRKSVYDNDYECRCGKKLFENGDVCEGILLDQETEQLICPDCGWNVAKVTSEDKARHDGAIEIRRS